MEGVRLDPLPLREAVSSTGDDGLGPPRLRSVERRRVPTAAVLMREYVRQGRSLRSVADEYGLSVAELRELIVGYGLPLHRGVAPAPTGTAGLTEEHLRAEYLDKGRSAAEIAEAMGVSEQSVLRYLHRYGIEVRRGGSADLGQLLTRELLQREYVERGRSAAAIAEDLEVSEQSVLRYLRRAAIPTRRPSGLGAILTTEYLAREYGDRRRTVADLAGEHQVSEQAIRNWLKRRGIPMRGGGGARVSGRLTAAYLHREYEQRGRTVAEIAADQGVSEQSVLRYLHRYDIPVRRGRVDPATATGTNGAGRSSWLEGVLTEELLRQEYGERGRSAADIARQVGASEQSVLRYLHRLGIPVRPPANPLGAVLTKEYLEEQYLGQGRSLGDIGRSHGVSGETVRKWLVRHGIERRHADRDRVVDHGLLQRRYVDEGQSISAIAAELGLSPTTVAKRLDRLGIERRAPATAPDLADATYLHREYVERGRTMAEIAADLGVAASTVRKHLDRHGIPVRPKNAQPLLERVLSSGFLEREYVEAGRTAQDIAGEVGVSEQTVLRYLHRHGLPVRPAGFGAAGGAETPSGEPERPAGGAERLDSPAVGGAAAGHLPGDDEDRLRAWLLGARSAPD